MDRPAGAGQPPRYFVAGRALFARSLRVLRLALLLSILGAGCAPGDDGNDAAVEETVPIGPGSDSTALIPRDTPMTSREPTTPGSTVPDSVPPTTTR